MGVLPLQFPDGESAESLGLTGEETLDLAPLEDGRHDAQGERRRRGVRGPRSHRHAHRMALLPPRGDPALRAARPPCAADSRLTHHDLCFGCGQANLFGLQMEISLDGERSAHGRFFVKQDHQGPPGYAHGGIMATALDEAMSLLAHHVGGYPSDGVCPVGATGPPVLVGDLRRRSLRGGGSPWRAAG